MHEVVLGKVWHDRADAQMCNRITDLMQVAVQQGHIVCSRAFRIQAQMRVQCVPHTRRMNAWYRFGTTHWLGTSSIARPETAVVHAPRYRIFTSVASSFKIRSIVCNTLLIHQQLNQCMLRNSRKRHAVAGIGDTDDQRSVQNLNSSFM